jgi:uncharacterized membrane protein
MSKRIVAVVLILVAPLPGLRLRTAAAQDARFVPLAHTPGDTSSGAFGVSDDGRIIVGESSSLNTFHATRWIDGRPDIPPGGVPGGDGSGVSAHGEAIVGGSAGMFRWTAVTGWANLGYIGLPGYGAARGVSADGKVVVGNLGLPSGGSQAIRWTAETGLVNLGRIDGMENSAEAVSDNGNVVVGGSTGYGNRAFIWTPDLGIRPLDGVPATSRALGISGDGKVVVGGIGGSYAFRWQDGTVEIVGPGEARAVSDDGNTIVGGYFGSTGFVWTRSGGSESIVTYFQQFGIAPAGWRDLSVYAMTPDASVLVGTGQNPEGNQQGFYVFVPEPAYALMFFVPLACLLCLQRSTRCSRSSFSGCGRILLHRAG